MNKRMKQLILVADRADSDPPGGAQSHLGKGSGLRDASSLYFGGVKLTIN